MLWLAMHCFGAYHDYTVALSETMSLDTDGALYLH